MNSNVTFRTQTSNSRIGELSLLIGLALVALLTGCNRSEKITRVTVDADQSGVTISPVESVGKQNVTTDRMVVAIFKTPQATWTFKTSGKIADVDLSEDVWLPFFNTVTFSEQGKPEWELPEGWTKAEVAPGPFAPYDRLNISENLQMSISSLPPAMDLLSNVNRWHGQLSIAPVREVDLQEVTAGKTPFLLFDEKGSLGGGGMSPPFAGGGRKAQPPAIESPIDFEEPEGWTPGEVSPMVAARFSKSEGELTSQITVSRLPSGPNSWDQVSRNWAAEVGTTELTVNELGERSKTITIDSNSGRMIRLVEEGAERGTVAARIPIGENAWFMKLSGDRELVAKGEEDFLKFIDSIRFK